MASTRHAAWEEAVKAGTAKLLEPGEEVQVVIPANRLGWYFAFFAHWVVLLMGRRLIVVTDRRILLCRLSRLRARGRLVEELLGELPRATMIGPVRGRSEYRTRLLGQRLYIDRTHFEDVAVADAAAQTRTTQSSIGLE